MSYKNLSEFVKTLESRQELIRIKAPVSSHLEITEIADRMSKTEAGGKALLFERVTGSPFPLLLNAFGSERRLALALETEDLAEPGKRLQRLLDQDVPKTIRGKIHLFQQALELSRYLPRVLKGSHPPCQEVIYRDDDVDLSLLPVLHCWPQDGGPFITLPVVFAKDLHSGKRNVGMYRMQIYDKNTTGMHWHIHKDGAHFFRDYEKKQQRMEVAVAIGTEPALTYAATAPVPRGLDELLLAGFLRRSPVTLVPALTVDLDVPAEAEFILEGYIEPGERRLEGPFGDHTGYYSLPDLYPVFHVTALTHRRSAIYSTTVVGRPPMEDCYLALATEKIFLPLLRTVFPEISDYWLPWEGVFHNLAIVAIDKAYPGQARKVMQGLWGSGQMSFCKTIVVVDSGTPLRHGMTLLTEILSRLDLTRDVFLTEGILDMLDHTSATSGWGGKLGIDATEALSGEKPRAAVALPLYNHDPEQLLQHVQVIDAAFLACRVLFPELPLPVVIFKISKSSLKRANYFRDLLVAKKIIPQGLVLLYDAAIDIREDSLLLWKAFNNVDPLRDILLQGQLAIIDATVKDDADCHPRPWPDDAVMSAAVQRGVDARLEELGLSRLLKGDREGS